MDEQSWFSITLMLHFIFYGAFEYDINVVSCESFACILFKRKIHRVANWDGVMLDKGYMRIKTMCWLISAVFFAKLVANYSMKLSPIQLIPHDNVHQVCYIHHAPQLSQIILVSCVFLSSRSRISEIEIHNFLY